MKSAVHFHLLAILAGLAVGSCAPTGELPAPPRQPAFVKANGDPLQIAAAGHGMILDSQMRPIRLDARSAALKQRQLLAAVQQQLGDDPGAKAVLASHAKAMAGLTFAPDARFLINAALIGALAARLEGNEALKYRLQNELLIRNIRQWRKIAISPALQAILDNLLPDLIRPAPDTDYMARCRSAGVPIPPDWAETGTAWVNQGSLGRNLLVPGAYAGVYTYHDRTVRGACVALPRDPISPGSIAAAGIICQSATTGAACFWDNIPRAGGIAATRIDWRGGVTLKIRELQDGDMLRENCTSCHTGNNVYLVSPDDGTWGKLLRRSMAGTDHGNFTLRVRSSTDNSGAPGSGGTARYVPISSQAGWRNRVNAPGCANGCHEGPSIMAAVPMPPACAMGGVGNCYVDPF